MMHDNLQNERFCFIQDDVERSITAICTNSRYIDSVYGIGFGSNFGISGPRQSTGLVESFFIWYSASINMGIEIWASPLPRVALCPSNSAGEEREGPGFSILLTFLSFYRRNCISI